MDSKLAAGRGGSPHPPVDLHLRDNNFTDLKSKPLHQLMNCGQLRLNWRIIIVEHVYFISTQTIQKTSSQSISLPRHQMTLAFHISLSTRSWQDHKNSRLKSRFLR